MKHLQDSVCDVLIKWRYGWLFVSLLCLGLIATGIPHLRVNPELKALIDADNPFLKALDVFEAKYASTDQVFILVSQKDAAVSSPAGLRLVRQVSKDVETLPHSYRIDSLTNFRFSESVDDDLTIDSLDGLQARGILGDSAISEYVQRNELVTDRLITRDGRVAMVSVTFNISGDRNQGLADILSGLKQRRSQWLAQFPDADVHFAGGLMIEAEMAEIINRDNAILVPLMLLAGFVINIVLLRSLAGYLAGLAIILISVVAAAGASGLLGIDITNVSSMGFMLVIVLATADTVHLTANYIANLRKGMLRFDAARTSLADNMKSMLLTNVTTVIGFLSLNTAGSPQLAAMGNIGAMGIVFALVFSWTVFPSVLLVFKVRVPQQPLLLTRLSASLTDFAIRFRIPLLATFGCLMLASAFYMLKLVPDEDRYGYFRPGTENYATQQFSEHRISAQRVISVDISTGSAEGITDPAVMTKIESLNGWIRQQPQAVYVFSYTDILKRLNKAFHGNDTGYFRIPDTQALASQLLLAYEMSMSYGQDIFDLTNFDKSSVRMTIGLEAMGSRDMLQFKDALSAQLGREFGSSGFAITGMDLVFSDHSQKSLQGMIGGDFLTLFIVTLVIVLVLRSFRYGMLSLIPNLAAPVLMYGIWAIFTDKLSLAAVATFSVCLGIIMDDTLHGLVKYLKARDQGHSAEESIRYSLVTSGPAIIVTTLILAAGASLMALSKFAPNAEVGLVMAPMVIFALAFEFLVFPGLVIQYERWFGRKVDIAPGAESATAA